MWKKYRFNDMKLNIIYLFLLFILFFSLNYGNLI